MKIQKSVTAGIRTFTIIASFTSVWLGIPNAAIGAQSDQPPLAQWASSATATSQYSDTDWSASQAIGAPNVTGCGDNGLAWASQDKGGKDDLTLGFDVSVIPSQLKIYETYNPGSITGVTLVPADGGKPINIAKSADTGTACPGVFTLAITGISTAVNRVIIHLNQAKIGNWNEIDAVQLIGAPSAAVVSQWATAATASSQFGTTQWAASQATGAPNVTTCGDNTSAWASSAKNSKETLTLTFGQAVIPSGVKIYETYNPGSITSVDLVPADGSKAITVAKSTDHGTSCPGVFSLSITGVSTLVNGVVIHFDQSKIGNWDEIDAVQLIGQFTNTASASATAAATAPAAAATAPATPAATDSP